MSWGWYDSTPKTYKALAERGVEPHSEEWKKAIADTIARQKEAMKPRLFPAMPPNRYVCFYPMDRRRGEEKNWYTLPMEERQRQMNEHGLVGRRYAGEVKQIITGSIGFDDWEWGVDLFADDPLVFKKLIYEMRFDHVSAVYALFGSFYVGLRCPVEGLFHCWKESCRRARNPLTFKDIKRRPAGWAGLYVQNVSRETFCSYTFCTYKYVHITAIPSR